MVHDRIESIRTLKRGTMVELSTREGYQPNIIYYDKNNNMRLDEGDLVVRTRGRAFSYSCRKGSSPLVECDGRVNGCIRSITGKDIARYQRKINPFFRPGKRAWYYGMFPSYPQFIDVNKNGILDRTDMIVEGSDARAVCPAGKKWSPHQDSGYCVRKVDKEDIARHGLMLLALFSLGRFDRIMATTLLLKATINWGLCISRWGGIWTRQFKPALSLAMKRITNKAAETFSPKKHAVVDPRMCESVRANVYFSRGGYRIHTKVVARSNTLKVRLGDSGEFGTTWYGWRDAASVFGLGDLTKRVRVSRNQDDVSFSHMM